MRRLAIALALALVCLVAAGPSGTAARRVASPRTAALPSVTRDAEGIPHIVAANDLDAVRMLGFVHAQDRFFQMDYLRHQLSGTLAELVGQDAIASDIQFRTLGLRRAAQATLDASPSTIRLLLQCYSDGVNEGLFELSQLPPEYAALELTRAKIPAWTPLDTITIVKGISFGQSFDLNDIFLTAALGAFQEAGAAGGFDGTKLFAEDVVRDAPFDPTVTTSLPAAAKQAAAKRTLPRIRPETARLARRYLDTIRNVPALAGFASRGESRSGSNWWVVAGTKGASGAALLASDPHLDLTLAPVFYEAHVTVTNDPVRGPMNVAGVSFAGTPAITLGVNDRIAWGITYNPLDVTDVYEEKLVFDFRHATLKATVFGKKKEKLVLLPQEFITNLVGNGTDDDAAFVEVLPNSGGIVFLVPRRNNGPIVSVDPSGGLNGLTGLSVQYTGWGATHELEAFFALERAQNFDDFTNAVKLIDMPTVNVGYADVDGNIGYLTSGELPLREDLAKLGHADGAPPFFVRDGTHAFKNEWIKQKRRPADQAIPYRIMPFDLMPHDFNPAKGYIANGNNDPVGTTLDNDQLNTILPDVGVYYLAAGYEGGFRVGRISRLLDAGLANGGKISLDDMGRIQSNNQMLDAEVLAPQIAAAFERASAPDAPAALAALAADPRVVEAVGRLAAWDYSTPTGLAEGYDPGDDPEALPEPSESEVRASVAATIYAVWRGRVMANTIDATLERVGLADLLPDDVDSVSMASLRHLLDTFPTSHGVGASGLNFFEVPDAVRTPEEARDVIMLRSLAEALDALAGDEYAAAFNNSTDQLDYRWGRLHRIVFRHPLGAPFDVPSAGGFRDLAPDLPGVARAGGYGTVDAAIHPVRGHGPNGFMYDHGPARRFLGELLPSGIRALEVIPGGESGDATNARYADQLGRWLTNHHHTLEIRADP